MRILLDSHALVWFVRGDARCSPMARQEISRSEVFVSAATAWEVATKVRLGKWAEAEELVAAFEEVMTTFSFASLPITIEHGRRAGSLAGAHKDPFDRILAAQAQIEDLTLATADIAFRAFDVRMIW